MAVYEFPALGFDPAPGDPASVGGLHPDVRAHADSLANSAQQLSQLHAAAWAGRASDAFHEHVRSLPADLSSAAHAYGEVAAALSAYANELEAARAQALRLESQAVEARQAHQVALVRVHELSGPAPGETDSSARVAQLSTATQLADQLGGDYQAILSRAHALRDHMESVASAAAARIQAAAASPPYREPGGPQQAWDHVTSFVREHAAAIRQISSVLKVVSAVAGLLALIPVVGEFIAPVALIAAGVAIGLDILLKLSTGEGSWTEIGLMAALTFVPGGKLIRVGEEAGRTGGRLPMDLRTVTDVADRYGVDLSGVPVRIRKDRIGYFGETQRDRTIELARDAFQSEGQLARTIYHERYHVSQLDRGVPFPSNDDEVQAIEIETEAAENSWWSEHPLNPSNIRAH
jgi:uncharacterized protein YukE